MLSDRLTDWLNGKTVVRISWLPPRDGCTGAGLRIEFKEGAQVIVEGHDLQVECNRQILEWETLEQKAPKEVLF